MSSFYVICICFAMKSQTAPVLNERKGYPLFLTLYIHHPLVYASGPYMGKQSADYRAIIAANFLSLRDGKLRRYPPNIVGVDAHGV